MLWFHQQQCLINISSSVFRVTVHFLLTEHVVICVLINSAIHSDWEKDLNSFRTLPAYHYSEYMHESCSTTARPTVDFSFPTTTNLGISASRLEADLNVKLGPGPSLRVTLLCNLGLCISVGIYLHRTQLMVEWGRRGGCPVMRRIGHTLKMLRHGIFLTLFIVVFVRSCNLRV